MENEKLGLLHTRNKIENLSRETILRNGRNGQKWKKWKK